MDTELDDSLAITRLFLLLFFVVVVVAPDVVVSMTSHRRGDTDGRERVTMKTWMLGLSDNNKSKLEKKIVWFTKEKKKLLTWRSASCCLSSRVALRLNTSWAVSSLVSFHSFCMTLSSTVMMLAAVDGRGKTRVDIKREKKKRGGSLTE